ncbi:MAG: excinuclease ABC subunit UvrA, partial [Chitinophagales bacterium]|nr:excinuclease ABC subunit UvrA [Chitinophagales bacterium]
IAIEQMVSTGTNRSTVGSLTEIYDYLRLLFARVGRTYSPVSGAEVTKHEVGDVVDFIFSLPEGEKVLICFSAQTKKTAEEELRILLQKGFTRIIWEGNIHRIEDALSTKYIPNNTGVEFQVLVDRIVVHSDDEDLKSRVADSVQTAFNEGGGECMVVVGEQQKKFNDRFEADGITFETPSPNFFNFNNPYGACKTCEGFGTIIGIDEDLVFPDKSLSVYEGAIAPWRGEKMREWLQPLLEKGILFDFPIHRPYCYLTEEEKKLLWTGNDYFYGLNYFFKYLEEKSYKIQYRVLLSRYKGRTTCPDCGGSRIRKDALFVKLRLKPVNGASFSKNGTDKHDYVNIADLLLMPVKQLQQVLQRFELTPQEEKVATRILAEIINRVNTLVEVGLGYLTLNRLSNTLSGGETQRINLTRSIGSNLTASMYILDEPSIGLHQHDTANLIRVLKKLRDLGNTVIVVEHDEDIMRQSDYIIDMGPEAGINGGQVVGAGTPQQIIQNEQSLTAKYLNGKLEIPVPTIRRKASEFIEIQGAAHHNLKNIDVKIPLKAFTVVTGVSGSGKTTLIKTILYPALLQHFNLPTVKPGTHRLITGNLKSIQGVEMIDQNPLGRSTRSNPVTYIGAYDSIRDLYSRQPLSKTRGFTPGTFSFNIPGGRCEECKGEGEVIVEMQFLADVHLRCEACNGKKFKDEVLEVTYNGKNIFDVLEMTVNEALDFFNEHKEICTSLEPLREVGLGYVKLGQSSSTLSGGEAQRLKLATFIGKGSSRKSILFIFDEPTTGLHFHDIHKLLHAFNKLIEAGHTILVIEHNMDVIKCADWLIDLGPTGGDEGGHLLYQGPPEGLTKVASSLTGKYLKPKLKRK